MADNSSIRFSIGYGLKPEGIGRTAFTVPVRDLNAMIFSVVGKHRFDSSESCSICLKFIQAGQIYVRAESKTAHYKCAKKRHWKRKSRAKEKEPEVVSLPRKIKIVRNGLIIN